MQLPSSDFRSPTSCYVFSLYKAQVSATANHSEPIGPDEHGLWSGGGRRNSSPIMRDNTIRDIFPSSTQHSVAEYMEDIISYIGRTLVYMTSFLDITTPAYLSEDGSRGGLYRRCASCGGDPPEVRPPITLLTVRLPREFEVAPPVSALLTKDLVTPGPLEQYTTDCLALAPDASICDAPLVLRDIARQSVSVDSIFVVALNRDGLADEMYQKNMAEMRPEDTLTHAGDTWYLRAVVSHFGENMDSGHYVAACALPCGAFMVANDAVVSGPLAIDEAWEGLNSEPSLLLYDRGRMPPA